jgi:hypothetical protein
MATTTQSYRRRDRSLRLSFRFELGEFTLFDRRELEMRALPTNDLEPLKPQERSGFWVEVQDQRGRALYRRSMPHPMIRRSEAHDDETVPRTVMWVEERGAFSVVVPNLSGGAELVMFGSPTDQPEIPQPAAEIMRVPLREHRTQPDDHTHDHGEGRS